MTLARLSHLVVLLLAIITIVIAAMMGSPPAPVVPMAEGFSTPILALEFAQAAEDVAFLQGEEAAELRAALTHTQALDRYFPLAYAGMAAVFFAALWSAGRRLALVGMLLAILTIPADWWENSVIDQMLILSRDVVCEPGGEICMETRLAAQPSAFPSGYEPSDGFVVERTAQAEALTAALPALQLTTWTKWGLIAAYALMMTVLMWQEKRRILAIPGAVAALALTATFLSGNNGYLAEIMGMTMLPFMLSFPIASALSVFARKA